MAEFVKAPDQPVETDLTMTEDGDGCGLFVKHHFIAKAGTMLPQHAHSFSHVSVIAHGGVNIWKDGHHWRSVLAPASVRIEAGVKHAFCTTLPNTVLLCVHRSDMVVTEEHQIV